MSKTAIVTGGTSGIGLAAVRALEKEGLRVYALSRRAVEGVDHIACDVTDEAAVKAAVDEAASREGRLDILVCCAGFGISGAAEFTDAADSRRQLDVNLFGADRAVRAALPHMRAQGGGRIVLVSSVAAVAPIPFQTWYSVSKAAINAYAMALANEVRPFNISVTAVMPGDIKTGFTAARNKSAAGDDVYGGRIARSVAKMEMDELNGMPAEKAGAAVARAALKKSVKPYYSIGFSYKLICVLIKLLPSSLACRIIGMLYSG